MFTNLLLAGTLGDQLDTAFHGFDMGVFSFFGNIQGDFITILAKAFSAMGSAKYIILFAVMGLVLCFFKRTRKFGFAIVFSVIIGTLITNIIVKPMVLRIRPYNTLQSDAQFFAWYLGAGALCESDYSFPSGHTTGAFEIATTLFICHLTSKGRGRKFAWVFPVVALLTAASRIYLMVHYSTDVIAGILIGIVAGILGYLISSALTKFIQKRKVDDIVDLARIFKQGLSEKAGAIMIVVVWIAIFAFSFLTSLSDGGPETVRCAYDREYKCNNEAQVDSKKYPAISGKNYCKIHWKQLEQEYNETGNVNNGEDFEDYLEEIEEDH